MENLTLLQTGPEEFDVLLGDGRRRRVTLAHDTRRDLGLTGVPPLHVATEAVRIILERGESLEADGGPVDLGPALGRDPVGFEELRVRLG